MPATVRVHGEAAIRVEPDDALLVIALTAIEDRPGAALSDVSTRTQALAAILDRLGVAKADRSTTGISVEEEFDHSSRGRRSVGHRAVNRMSVRMTDHELIGQVIVEATEQLAAQVEGPHWAIARSNPARLQAAREAAADARRRAQAYAEGVGARLGPPLKLSETQAHMGPRRGGGFIAVAAAAGPLPLEAGEQEVLASVQVTFALEFDDQ